MWPRIQFDPIKLFDLSAPDLRSQDPYFVRLCMPGYEALGDDFFIGLLDLPEVVGFLCDVCPERVEWLRYGVERVRPQSPARVSEAEAKLLVESMPWNLGMAKSPAVWDALPWSYWAPSIIYDRVNLRGKTVLDIGAGTGQVTLRCAPYATSVIALEPVTALRRYIERKMTAAGFTNVCTLAGILETSPLEDASIDIAILSNGSFGWNPEVELRELERVTTPDGVILMLGPCNHSNDKTISLIRDAGYEQFEFEVPCDGMKPGFIRRKHKDR
jgi:hypothetical protein